MGEIKEFSKVKKRPLGRNKEKSEIRMYHVFKEKMVLV
jgi:hypothetical protein